MRTPDIRTCTWEQLDRWVEIFRWQYPDLGIWDELVQDPITVDAVVDLAEWYRVDHTCYSRLGMIPPGKRLSGFVRDMALFHELAHRYYDLNLPYNCDLGVGENLAITDWIARKARADVEILRQVTSSFNLEPKTYDRVSLLASPEVFDPDKQLAFPFGQKRLQELKKVRMDFRGLI